MPDEYRKSAVCSGDPYEIPYPELGSVLGEQEISVLTRLVESGENLSGGRFREEFERCFREYLGVPHALSVTSGTVALEIAIRLLDLNEGDEVIATPQTYKASVQPLLNYPVKVRFCDVEPTTLNIDPEHFASLITSRTRAVILVHYGGLPCDMDAIMAIARRHGITVIEDCAHALGAEYRGRKPGALADIGCFSFHSSKNITTLGEGGMITLFDRTLAERADRIRSNDADAVYREQARTIGETTSAHPWMMHPGVAFTHDCSAIRYGGTNATLAEPNAAVGTVQLAKLDRLIGRRADIAGAYTEVLQQYPGVRMHEGPEPVRHGHHLYTFFADPAEGFLRDRLVSRLDALGVQMQLRYFPLHLLAEWRARGHDAGECPVAERLWFEQQVNLPCHPGMPDRQVDQVVSRLETVLRQEVRGIPIAAGTARQTEGWDR
ncbi:DegT/DnrJ/EryC1/StrS family aminotransferase [Streptomyces sp. SID14515]|uniref:DegT/DnrJ/EryC1/StrS aminotransferase family protein n=1 Tax=Streptomyces sp. SID14515 TaxID=2706074 RepID=UPI0013C711CD|nr:DegT/DnrJ/EryC1/StrS family aminotransferase [Streptomyces sp. SID14515]NEB40591.1 DegT/DnrJ/EryC1/StrS family aminotransferase [Streptomyces sp. SID14515]